MAVRRLLVVSLLALALSACEATRQAPAATPGPAPAAPPAPAATRSEPTPAAALPNDIKWVQRSAEYYASILDTYRAATARVEQ
jgi:hypothetical protein